jgi:pimeloyl-ACP methyl ester carboxylesterase
VLVQPAVAKVTRVCSCDRGGEAWSDLGPKPRTKAQEAFNLRRALHAAGEVGPFVLVGHSMGGDVVRMYAMDHPTEVAGMVLVDAGTPDAMTNLNGHVGTTRSFSHGRAIPAPRESLAADDSLTQLGISRIQEATRSLVPSIGPPFDKLPAEQQRWRLWALGQPKHFIAHDGDYIGEEAERIYAENHRSLSPLADLPLVVLCRDTTVDKSHDPLHVTHQREMARLSRRGEFRIVAGAGHHIHLDRPKAVVDGILQVVKEARESAGAKR